MNKITKYAIGTFTGVLIIASIVAMVNAQETVSNMRAMELAEGNARIVSATEINKTISAHFIILYGTGNIAIDRGDFDVTYNLTYSVAQLNNQKVNAIRQYGYEHYGYLMPKTAIIYRAYDRGQ